MKKICFIIISLVFAISYGQDETTNWYFGKNAGLRFNKDGSVTELTNGKINTEEGCASISDKAGVLLFYTDGITVYDRNHSVMQNGTGLYGDPSSTQSAIIVPAPASDDVFFIFTVDTSIEEDDPNFGFNYSIVDISENNGIGAVTAKNINLLQTCSEKITAVVKNCSEESVWVMTLSTVDGINGLSDTFHAFEVNDQGVNQTSVKSTFSTTFGDQRGYLKLSSDGKKMASANELDGLYLYDFNAETGVVSNPEKISISGHYKNPYSVEFSPNNQYLYVHTHSDAPAMETNHNSNLLQYDLFSSNISQSKVVLHQSNNYRGALQLGANGKIYRTLTKSYIEGTQYLGVIDKPNLKGEAADYQHNAIYLNGGIAMQGLPPFIQSFFAKKGLIKTADGTTSTSATFCDGKELVLEADELPGATYYWEHDGVPLMNENNNILRIETLNQSHAGQYRLIISQADATQCDILGEAQIQINEPPIANNYSLTQCDIDDENANASSDGFTYFNLDQTRNEISPNQENLVTFYRTLADLENNFPIEITYEFRNETVTNQTIYAKVTDSYGCTNEAELALEVSPSPSDLSTGAIYYSCTIDPSATTAEGSFDLVNIKNANYESFDVVFYNSKIDASLEINPILENIYTSTSSIIYARIEATNQCLGVEAIELVVNPTPVINIDPEYLVCTNDPNLLLEAETGFDIYAWYKIDESNNETLISNAITVAIVEPGNYRLELGWSYVNGTEICTNSSDFKVLPSNNAIISEVEIEDLQENNKLTIIAIGDGDYEFAIGDKNGPYTDSPEFDNVAPGKAKIYVRDKNGCGITEEEVSVIGFQKFFTPNGDGVNEKWNLIGIPFDDEVSLSIYDRYGKLLHQVNRYANEGWDGTFNNQPLPAADYWFRVNLEAGRVYQGHFTLKR
ncbi:T9SS type B sorting domain-containing protein [Aurantibacter crassamenti]|uniref:T9SS type B sorting domain-containing protein n=1 Tax=Aurantibacter crassamenti TaxID=1837375 RepID=UPI00193ABF29|nr:T9SS type B sorting domain-containing protein [Aurantibacter crassamenti]MBM1106420.1 T9SS type B sorting domain-containing protein [Aurantibacter crassamenti]